MLDMLNDAVDIAEMLPHETPNAFVLGNCFVPTAWELVARGRAFDGHVVDEGNGNVRDLILEKISRLIAGLGQ